MNFVIFHFFFFEIFKPFLANMTTKFRSNNSNIYIFGSTIIPIPKYASENAMEKGFPGLGHVSNLMKIWFAILYHFFCIPNDDKPFVFLRLCEFQRYIFLNNI